MKVLVIGAAGNIAGQAARYLCNERADSNVRLTTRSDEGAAALRDAYPAAEVLVVDPMDRKSLGHAMKGCQAVISVSPDNIDETEASTALAEAIDRAGTVEHIVKLVTHPHGLTLATLLPEAREIPIGYTQSMKARAVLDATSLPVTYLNVISYFMSNLLWSLELIRTKNVLVMPEPQDYTWLSPADIGQMLATLATEPAQHHAGNTYFVSGEESLSYEDIAQLLSKLLHRPIRYSSAPADLQELFGDSTDLYVKYFRLEREVYRNVLPSRTAARLLGRAPQTVSEWLVANRPILEAGGDA